MGNGQGRAIHGCETGKKCEIQRAASGSGWVGRGNPTLPVVVQLMVNHKRIALKAPLFNTLISLIEQSSIKPICLYLGVVG